MQFIVPVNVCKLSWTLFYSVLILVHAARKDSKCMRHYFVETIKHPTMQCSDEHVLLARCEGHCSKSRTLPLLTFKPILYKPFKYICHCCMDQLSVMKAVRMRCYTSDRKIIWVYATYRYIIRCGCEMCDHR